VAGLVAVGLVAAGLTNRRIAARLGVSERTVDTRVARVLAKLGAASRAQVAGRLGGAGPPAPRVLPGPTAASPEVPTGPA
jgi:hypothetical protein